jgi:hypothetical protein
MVTAVTKSGRALAGIGLASRHSKVPYAWQEVLVKGIDNDLISHIKRRLAMAVRARVNNTIMKQHDIQRLLSLRVNPDPALDPMYDVDGENRCRVTIYRPPLSATARDRIEKAAVKYQLGREKHCAYDLVCRNTIGPGYMELLAAKVLSSPSSWTVMFGRSSIGGVHVPNPNRPPPLEGVLFAEHMFPGREFYAVPLAEVSRGVLMHLVCTTQCSGKTLIRLLMNDLYRQGLKYIFLEAVVDKYMYYVSQYGAFCVDSPLMQNRSLERCRMIRVLEAEEHPLSFGAIPAAHAVKKKILRLGREDARSSASATKLVNHRGDYLVPMAIDIEKTIKSCSSLSKPPFRATRRYDTRQAPFTFGV